MVKADDTLLNRRAYNNDQIFIKSKNRSKHRFDTYVNKLRMK
jgi:hypothetical protein